MPLLPAAIDVEWTPLLRAQSKVGNIMAVLMPRARIVPAVRPQVRRRPKHVHLHHALIVVRTVGWLAIAARLWNMPIQSKMECPLGRKTLR